MRSRKFSEFRIGAVLERLIEPMDHRQWLMGYNEQLNNFQENYKMTTSNIWWKNTNQDWISFFGKLESIYKNIILKIVSSIGHRLWRWLILWFRCSDTVWNWSKGLADWVFTFFGKFVIGKPPQKIEIMQWNFRDESSKILNALKLQSQTHSFSYTHTVGQVCTFCKLENKLTSFHFENIIFEIMATWSYKLLTSSNSLSNLTWISFFERLIKEKCQINHVLESENMTTSTSPCVYFRFNPFTPNRLFLFDFIGSSFLRIF